VVINGQIAVTPGGKVRIDEECRRRQRARGQSGGAIMNLSEPFIRRPVMTAVLTVSVIVFGVLSYRIFCE